MTRDYGLYRWDERLQRVVCDTSVPADHEPEPVRPQDVLTDEELAAERRAA